MMRKTITRTLTRATVNGYTVKMEGNLPVVTPLDPVTAWGNLTDKEAEKVLVEKYGKEVKPIVGEITYNEETYKIDIPTFVEFATLVEGTETESEQSEEN